MARVMQIPTQLEHAIAGLLGGIISLVYTKKLAPASSIATIFVSFVASWYLGDLIATRFSLPPSSAGFIVGLSSMRICALIAGGDWIKFIIGTKEITLPEEPPKKRKRVTGKRTTGNVK